jgi:phage tail-like protein
VSTQIQSGYRFASASQWAACLLVGADRTGSRDAPTIRPFAAFRTSATPHYAGEAYAPACTYAGELLWRDAADTLFRVSANETKPETTAAPWAVTNPSRIVASRDALWVAGTGATIECFDRETLARRFVVDLATRVIDVASDGRGGVRVLLTRGDAWEVAAVDGAGTVGARVPLGGMPEPAAFTYLRRSGRIAVLASGGGHVFTFPPEGGRPDAHVVAATLDACFVGALIASDTRERVFVAGTDDAGSRPSHVVVLDPFGVRLYDVPLREPATGLAASRGGLVVTSMGGVDVLPAADPVPETGTEVRTTLVTPMLVAPEAVDGRHWLRIEAAGAFPAGSSLEIAYGSTNDPEMRDRLLALAGDPAVPEPKRAQALLGEEGFWNPPIIWHGRESLPNEDENVVAVPLHDVHDTYLWVAVSLTAGAGAKLPALTRLSVLYPGSTLMNHLPAIYQRDEAQPGSFICALVGILETTTQDLDARIAEMARYIHPRHAPDAWLDYVARWLGLPWDDGLTESQKRCLVRHGNRLARGRGTRAGLETLLACIVGGRPARFRVVDETVEHGLACLGDDECEGATLPTILGGLPATAARLDVQATLGAMRLPCDDAGDDDATARFLGRIRVDVAATSSEVAEWQPWLARLVSEVVPIGTRARVRWTSPEGLRGDRLGDALTLDADPPPRLGTNAIPGVARLPHTGSSLPASSDGEGPILE